MLTDRTRVKIHSGSFDTSHIHGRYGTVVSTIGDHHKVLLDKDKDKSKNPLTLAWWFYDYELEEITTRTDKHGNVIAILEDCQ